VAHMQRACTRGRGHHAAGDRERDCADRPASRCRYRYTCRCVTDSIPEGMSPEQVSLLRGLAKEELRKRVAALRRALVADTRAAHAALMCKQLVEHESFQRAKVVLSYSALRFEISPQAAIEAALASGKTIALPRTVPETRALILHEYRAGDALVESGFVVKEPLATAPVVAPEAVDVVLVPGLGFDLRGQRLGYGQGYYDRLLPQLANAVRVGLCFELSLLVEVPSEPFDVPVDWLITERRVVRCAR
jgi:5-formyltetrahydrofolate cyclo-ligase